MSDEQAEPIPPTLSSLTANLRSLGLASGMTVIVHSSMKAIAKWIIGDAQALILALEGILGPEGTLVMPTMSGNLSDPQNWQHPPVPASWWETIRQETPAFMPDLTATREMGRLAETFRGQEGVLRSSHPQTSFAAWGKEAAFITANHLLESPTGEHSPVARIYELDGHVLLLGVGHGNNTSLHLAEERATYPNKAWEVNGAPILVDGERHWVEFKILAIDESDFVQIGSDFARDSGLVREGKVGNATSLLMSQRALVDYGVRWMEQNRT
jgi:aminoglycoside 3-N-acetyltransferase